jgi:hypothetical protein
MARERSPEMSPQRRRSPARSRSRTRNPSRSPPRRDRYRYYSLIRSRSPPYSRDRGSSFRPREPRKHHDPVVLLVYGRRNPVTFWVFLDSPHTLKKRNWKMHFPPLERL